MKRSLIIVIFLLFGFIILLFFHDLVTDLDNCIWKNIELSNINESIKNISKEKEEKSNERIFITDLKSLNNSENIYKIYFEEDKDNDFLWEDFFWKNYYLSELHVIYHLEIETSENFDRIIYSKAWREWIIGEKIEWNKYEFKIKSFFDLPSDVTEWNIAFIKDDKVIWNDKIIVQNQEYSNKIIEYDRNYTTTFYLSSDLSILLHIDYWWDTSNQEIEIKNYDNYIVSKFNSLRGWDDWGYQYIYDLNWNRIEKIAKSVYPEYINVWDLKYNYSWLNYEYEVFTYYPDINDYLIFDLDSFDNLPNLEKIFFEEKAILPENLIIWIKWNPYFLKYKLEDLWTPNISYWVIKVEKEDEKYINKDWKVVDLEFTKKILKQITEDWNNDRAKEKDTFKVVFIEYYGVSLPSFYYPEIENIPNYFEKKDIPLINLYKIDDIWNYSLSFYPPYDFSFQRM